jgi:hypothetical protein
VEGASFQHRISYSVDQRTCSLEWTGTESCQLIWFIYWDNFGVGWNILPEVWPQLCWRVGETVIWPWPPWETHYPVSSSCTLAILADGEWYKRLTTEL